MSNNRTLDFKDGFESAIASDELAVSASEVEVTPTGNLASDDVQAALVEHQGDIDAINTSLATKASDADLDALAATVATLATDADLDAHVVNTSNPHAVTKAQVGLSNVDNTSDLAKPISTATQTALDGKENSLGSGTSSQYLRGDKTFQTLDKAAVGLSNVDNTSDATKNSATATLTNKTLTGAVVSNFLDITDQTEPASPDAGRKRLYFDSTQSRFQYKDSNGIISSIGSGSGGGVNFITNSDAEISTTGWNTYADAAGTSPVDGTGGVANITWTRTALNGMMGNAYFLLTKDAANRQGQGVSTDFTIPLGYLGSVVKISMWYRRISGTFTAGTSSTNSDLTVWIFDKNTNTLYQPTNHKFFSNSDIVSDQFQAEFQVPVVGTDYRLIIHCGSTSASAFSVAFDEIAVSPNEYVFGSPISDWQEYTPAFTGLGSVTNAVGFWRRVGDKAEVRFSCTMGTTTAALGSVSMPSGLSINANKLRITNNNTSNSGDLVGVGTSSQTGASIGVTLITAPATSTTLVYIGAQDGVAANKLVAAAGTNIALSSSILSGSFEVPIAGWSSSVQMADSTSTRVVSFLGFLATNQVASTSTTIKYTAQRDSHSAYNATTGQFTVPVAGDYLVSGTSAPSGPGTSTMGVYVDNVLYGTLGTYISGGSYASGTLLVPNLRAGQTLDVRPAGTYTMLGAALASSITNLSISRISGPSQIASSDTVAASYWVSSNFSASTTVPINFDSREFDTHSAVSTSPTAWRFTAPLSGLYQIGGFIDFITGANCFLYKNGVIYKAIGYDRDSNNSPIFTTLQLNTGEYVDVRPSSSITATGGALNTASCNINITRIGNRG